MKFPIFSILFLGWLSVVSAQVETPYASDSNLPGWAALMYEESPDWGEVMQAFHAYYADHPFVKTGHTQYLKRMLREQETYHYQFVDPSLSEEERMQLRVAERQYLVRREEQDAARSGNWTSLGPWDWDHDAASRSYAPGAAHIYTVEQCLNDSDVLYAGTATAGLWTSTDKGANWSNITKDLLVNEVYAIEINPSNCNEIYASMLNGIYKSTNGGTSWSPTGDASFQALSISVSDIKFSPGSSSLLFAATETGLYRSTNSGGSWTQVMAGIFQEIEFHPSNSSIVYTIHQTGNQTQFLKSTDSGVTFVQQTMGWPVPAAGDENKRAEIAVTPDSPNKVYALLTGEANGGSGLYGVYTSTDSGVSWTFNCCGPQPGGAPTATNINMMGWQPDGSDDGGQYYYDLSLAVSPTDDQKIFVGAVNKWVSEDGGNTFTCPSKWSEPAKVEYVHADIHDINYYSTGDIWVASDGGIFHSTDNGDSFDRAMFGITGTDFWGFGVGFNNDELMLGGAYHNGTMLKNGGVYDNDWICTDGGDGVGGAVNPILEDQVYSDRNIKTMSNDRTISPDTRSYALEPSWSGTAGRFTQIEFAADNYNVHYFGNGSGLYKTEDDNRTVSEIHDFGEDVTDIEVAWTNPDVMYVTTWTDHWGVKKLYKSIDGGSNWTEITPPTSAFSSSRHIPLDVEVSYEDENLIWLARVGRQSSDLKKVFRSNDGGSTWTNITNAALDGEVLTNIIAQRGSNNNLYLGTSRSVYHSSGGGSSWTLFSSGLPASTRSRQLAISYRNNEIINATNRSVWVSNLAQSSSVEPQISVDKYYTGCARDVFQFADFSTAPANSNFQWSFPGATSVSSTSARDPEVLYGEAGTYDVSLTINGTTQTLNDFIEVGEECSPEPFAGNAMELTTSSQYFKSNSSLDITTNTLTVTAWLKPDGIQNSYAGIVFPEGGGFGLNFRNNNELGYHWTGGSTHWAWSSGLYVPSDEWSFVAMVITPNNVTFYLNEEKVVRNFSSPIATADLGTLRIGSVSGFTSSRNYKGKMDEVAIWNRALSQDELRDWRHLTKQRQTTPSDPLYDADLVAYYQFNESSGAAYDRAGVTHGTLLGNAARVSSTAPIGDGSSSRITVNSVGTYNFADEKLSLSFPAGGTYPGDEIVVTRLTNAPTDLPLDAFHNDHYWIVNNYGNETFTELEELEFWGLNGVNSTLAASPQQFTLNKRPSNADGADWGTYIDQADMAVTGGRISFTTDNSVTSFSQFVIGRDASLLPVQFLDLQLKEFPAGEVQVNWATASEENTDYFVIERSRDGRAFEAIGQEKAFNSTAGATYQVTDKGAYQGINYYRIKGVDFDGTLSYSPIRNISLATGSGWIKVYPNPLSAAGNLRLETNFTDEATFELFTADGRMVRRTRFTGSAYLRMPGLAAGAYSYRLLHGDQVISGKLVKE